MGGYYVGILLGDITWGYYVGTLSRNITWGHYVGTLRGDISLGYYASLQYMKRFLPICAHENCSN